MSESEYRIEADPRFLRGLDLLEKGEFLEASDEFEELFFEAVRDEIDFIRVFLQLSVGIHHVERGQARAAIERLEECNRVIDRVDNDRGLDLRRLRQDVAGVIPRIEARLAGERSPIEWPSVAFRGHSDTSEVARPEPED